MVCSNGIVHAFCKSTPNVNQGEYKTSFCILQKVVCITCTDLKLYVTVYKLEYDTAYKL